MAKDDIGIGAILAMLAVAYIVYVLYKNGSIKSAAPDTMAQGQPQQGQQQQQPGGGGGGAPAPLEDWSSLPPAGQAGGVPAPVFDKSIGGNIQGGNIPGSGAAEFQPGDLLPKDTNSEWAQMNPVGKGDLANVDLLQPGVHFNIDTIGMSNKNKNLQERPEPPNPQLNVGIWNQSPLTPNFMRPGTY